LIVTSLRVFLEPLDRRITSRGLATLAMPKQETEPAFEKKRCQSLDYVRRLNVKMGIRVYGVSGSKGADSYTKRY